MKLKGEIVTAIIEKPYINFTSFQAIPLTAYNISTQQLKLMRTCLALIIVTNYVTNFKFSLVLCLCLPLPHYASCWCFI